MERERSRRENVRLVIICIEAAALEFRPCNNWPGLEIVLCVPMTSVSSWLRESMRWAASANPPSWSTFSLLTIQIVHLSSGASVMLSTVSDASCAMRSKRRLWHCLKVIPRLCLPFCCLLRAIGITG